MTDQPTDHTERLERARHMLSAVLRRRRADTFDRDRVQESHDEVVRVLAIIDRGGEAASSLAAWAAAIRWDGTPNEPEWLDGLRERIERVQVAHPPAQPETQLTGIVTEAPPLELKWNPTESAGAQPEVTEERRPTNEWPDDLLTVVNTAMYDVREQHGTANVTEVARFVVDRLKQHLPPAADPTASLVRALEEISLLGVGATPGGRPALQLRRAVEIAHDTIAKLEGGT